MPEFKPSVVAVTGAGGYVGSVLLRCLKRSGIGTVALTRDPRGRRPDSFRSFRLEGPVDHETLKGVEVVIHSAWDLSIRRRDEIWAVNVEGTSRLLDAASRAGVEKMIFVSSMSAYDGTTQLYGRSKLAAESAALDFGACVTRFGLVYGPGAGGMAGSLRAMADLPVTPLVGGRSRQFVVHEEDMASAVLAIITSSEVPSAPVGVAYPEPVSFRTLLEGLASRRKPRFVPIPWRAVYLALQMCEAAHIRTPFRADSLLGLVRPAPFVPGQDWLRSLGVIFRPFEAGCRAGA